MKIFTKVSLLVLLLAVGQRALAQQWSDVSLGISPSPTYTTTNPTFTMDMAIHNNIPHVLIHTTGNTLAVMTYSGGVWTTLPSPTPPASANATGAKIAIDATGAIYVAYFTQAGNSLQVKKYNGSAWVTVGALAFASNDGPQALMIDPATNFPVIITRNQTGAFNLSAYRFNGTSWGLIGAAGFSPTISYSRAAISSTGTPFVLFDHGVGKFSVMKFDGANWVFVGVASFGDFSASSLGTDIAVDATGAPYVITQSTSTLKSSVIKHNGTAWVSVGAANFTPGAAHQARLNFNGTGSLHMVFQDATNSNRITAMRFNGTSWIGVGSPAFSGGAGRWPIIDFDTSNTPYVLFHDALLTNNNGSLMKLCTSNTATVASVTPGVVCGSGPITLSATSTGTLRWYNAATNGVHVGTGTSFVTPTLTNTTSTYSVAAYDAAGCSSPRTTVTATAKPVPVITATQPAGACVGATALVGATSDIGTISWYTTPTGGSPFATGIVSGSVVTTPTITATTSFYAEAVSNGCASSRSAVQVTAFQRPANPVAVNGVRCGPGTVSISVTSVPGTVQWFTAPTGGTLLASGNTFLTPSISTSTSYYADVTVGGCVSTGRTAVQAFVSTIPVITSSTAANRCGDGSVTLSVATSGDASAQWFTAPTGGTAISTLKTFVTPSLTTTTTYYAEAIENGCPSTTRTAVVATIKPIPTVTSANVSRCDAGTVTFEASSNGSISWFAAATGGSALGTGPNFTTPSISVTTPYFMEAILNGCTTPGRTSVSAIVNSTPPQPVITQNNSNIEAPVLTSSASSGNQWFKNDVILPGENGASHTITSAGLYKVQVSLNGCPSPFSENVTYVVTGIEDLSRITRLYPNPVADVLVIDLAGFKKGEIVTISVVDFLGRYLRQEQGNGGDELYVDVKPFNPGQYHLVLTQGKTRITKSFIRKF